MTASRNNKLAKAPAFPAAPHGDSPGTDGMSVLAYFMAHAPAVPQSWFAPLMPEKLADAWEGDSGAKYASAREAEIAEGFDHYFNANREAQQEWDLEYLKQWHLQWPLAWAELMVVALARGLSHD